MSTDSRSRGLRTADPVGDARAPGRERAAPLRILRHDAALAIRHADFVQDVGHVHRRSSSNQRSSGPSGRAFGEDQRVVLVHREQALAAARRAEHRKRIRCRAAAPCPPAIMRCSAMTAARRVSAPSSREITAAMSRPPTPSRQQADRDLRQLRPGGAKARRVLRLVDLVAQRDGVRGAQRAADRAPKARRRRGRYRRYAEMADIEAAHPPDRAVDEASAGTAASGCS